jgi:CRISP-associated protein Cas1
MRLLSTLYVADHRARVSLRHRSLVVITGDGGRSRVPLEALDAVVLAGYGQVTTDALAACMEQQIRVASLRPTGRLRFTVGGPIGGNVRRRIAQYRAADDPVRCTEIARWIVAGKLQNARNLVLRWIWDSRGEAKRSLRRIERSIAARIEALPDGTTGDAIRGHEGDGTRLYFEAMRVHLQAANPQLSFDVRSRRPPRDAVNAALSFVYALLLTETVGAADALGLDPQLGFLHGVRAGRPSLGLDLIEEFRPSIGDRFVVGLLTRGMISLEDFVETPGGAWYLSDTGRRTFLEAYDEYKSAEIEHALLQRTAPRAALPVIQATLMARHLRGDIPAYPPYVAAG